ncbi:MAG: DUF4920 domain-containing protein [Bacteroidota bacterium]
MIKLSLTILVIFFSIAVRAQEAAVPGVVYGEVKDKGQVITIDKLESNLKENKFEGKITGKVAEVCQAMGCWVKLQKSDGSTILVKAKDHGFAMPKDIVGKDVVIDGEATVKEVSEKMRRHYAEDAGKTKEEIEKIKGSSKEVTIAANGVKVI